MKFSKFIFIIAFFICLPTFSQTVVDVDQTLTHKTKGYFRYDPYQYLIPNSYSFDPIMTNNSYLSSGVLNSGIIFMADQLDHNVNSDSRALPTIVSSIADVNNLSETSQFGRILTENLIHELQVKNWNMIDARFTKNIIFNPAGEFSLSRDLDKLRSSSTPVGNVLTGTYVNTIDGVIVNLRLINVANGIVLSTAQTRLSRDKFIASLVDKPIPLPVIGFSR